MIPRNEERVLSDEDRSLFVLIRLSVQLPALFSAFVSFCSLHGVYVPYDGASKNRAAVMGRHNDISVLLVSEAATCIDSGDVVPLCVLGSERSEFYPDVSCASEVGDYDIDVSFHGVRC